MVAEAKTALPAGTYATVALKNGGHLVGRVERSAEHLRVEPVYLERLLPAILVPVAAVRRVYPGSASTALRNAPKDSGELQAAVAAAMMRPGGE